HHSMECGVDCAGRIASGRSGTGEALPNLLVAALRLCETAGLRCGRSPGPYPEFLRNAARAQRFGCSTSGERTVAVLFAGIVQEHAAESASSRSASAACLRKCASSP